MDPRSDITHGMFWVFRQEVILTTPPKSRPRQIGPPVQAPLYTDIPGSGTSTLVQSGTMTIAHPSSTLSLTSIGVVDSTAATATLVQII